MRGKLLFITGGLVGYVLGARAGRKRYDQIASMANDLWNAPPVQRRVTEARDFGLELVGDVPGALMDTGKKIFSSVVDRAGSGAQGAGKAGSSAADRPANAPKPKTAAKSAAAKSTAAKSTAAKPTATTPTASAESASDESGSN